MVRKAFVGALSCVLLTSPAMAKGPVVSYFSNDLESTSNLLVQSCIYNGMIVVEQDEHHVRCEKEMSGLRGALAHVLIGNAYSTTPNQVIRFSISEALGYSVVQASAWVETQMAFGQLRKQPIDGRKASNQLTQMMASAGGTDSPPTPTPLVRPQVSHLAPSAPPSPKIVAPPEKPEKPQRRLNGRVKCITCD